VPISSELPVGGDQEEPLFEEDFTQLVEEGKQLSLSALSFEPMSLHAKQCLLFLLLCINLTGKHLVKDLTRYFTTLP
jgi:hypothetical protein